MNNILRSMGALSKKTKIALTLFLAAATMGVVELYNAPDEVATENVVSKDGANTDIAAPLALDSETLNPNADDFIRRCIALENLTCIPLVYAETYRATPVVQPKENVWTHGYGMTWSPDKYGHMKIRDYEKTKKDKKGRILQRAHKPAVHRTKDADLEETQQFLIEHVYPKIKKYMKRKITLGEFFGLCVAGYQLDGHIKTICNQLNNAKTPQQVADAFITKTMYNYGGTPKRRWVCAMLATGKITLEDILNSYIDAFYKVNDDLSTIMKGRKHFICDRATVDHVLGIKGKKLTRAEIMETADGRLALEQLANGLLVMPENETAKTDNTDYAGAYDAATKSYKDGQYAAAATQFEQLARKYPKNAALRNDLAATYNKLGRYDDAIAQVQVIFKNLEDKSQYGAAYCNIGFAREKKGELPQALANYRLAVENGNSAAQNEVTRLEKIVKPVKKKDDKKPKGKTRGKNKKTKGKNKRMAFNEASKKLGNDAHSADFDLTQLVRNGHDMA